MRKSAVNINVGQDDDISSFHLVRTKQEFEEMYGFQSLPLSQKIVELTIIVTMELRENPLLIALMVGASITRLLSVLFSVYLLLWIQSFSEPEAQQPSLLFMESSQPVL